ILAACGGGGAVETVVVTEIVEGEVVEKVVTATPEAMEAGLNTVYFNWGTEPPTGDPQLATDTTSSRVIGSIMTGLTDIDDETKAAVPALATSWEPNEDSTEWTFTLRDDVPWVQYNLSAGEIEQMLDADGNPRMTTAQDVVYGVKRACDPNTGSDYAYIMYPIVGCEELNTTDPEAENFQELYDAVGVEAVDDFTVKFTLTYGAGFWPQVTTMSTTYPVYQPVVEEYGDRWVEPGFIVTNGAYVMEEWVHGDHLYLLKNDLWPMWGTDYAPGNVERLVGYTIEEDSTSFALYENNELDTSNLPLDQIDRVKADPVLSEEYVQAPSNCTYYYGFIMERDAVSDVKVRQALSMGIDRVTLVDQVLKGGQIPANTFTNPLNFGNAAEDPDIAPWALTEEKGGTGYAAAVEMGKALLEEAGYPNGDGLDILLMHNVSEGHARIAQAIQAFWSEAYPGINVTVETQEWGVYLETIQATTDVNQVPDVFRLGWCADYPHANNWVHEVFNPDQGANRTRMSVDDPQVGDLIAEFAETTVAAQTASEEEALGLYKRAEKLLNEEIAAIAPIYYYTTVGITKPWLDRTYDEIKLHLFQWELDQAAQMEAMQ
ncbi:MAG: peptide ABC transporter substrate-binding protein, partial [Anaerolineales bacterium]